VESQRVQAADQVIKEAVSLQLMLLVVVLLVEWALSFDEALLAASATIPATAQTTAETGV